ncbi:MAG: sigma-70 family RNA polymerase sigma factor [Candidatus Gastranaerophilales bacterium]|nr:sigma-70 family RNA polymerase sigma factor [Candidatus Gastranaerophilales bacterium]
MEEMYRENAKLIYHFLLSLCHDKVLAEDLTQETFLQAYRSLERYDGSCKLSSWLCQIAKHLYFQHVAKHRREIPTDLAEQAGKEPSLAAAGKKPQASSPEETTLVHLELLDMLKEMQKLPQLTREVLYLRLTGELSFREIGEILGKSENWARVTFYRGKEKLIQAARDAAWEEESHE